MGLGIFMSNQLPGKADAAGGGPHFEKHQIKGIAYKRAREHQANPMQRLRAGLATAPCKLCVCVRARVRTRRILFLQQQQQQQPA